MHHGGTASPRSSGSGSTLAESRHPQAGTGRGGFYGYGSSRYYRPYYYPHFYGSFYYGWPYFYDPFYSFGGYYGGGYYGGYYGAPGSYYGTRYGDRASLRVMVNPDKTRVFVDGYYAGIADDFDGLFQRLHVSPGRHEITLKLEGYRTHRMKVYVGAGSTLKIRFDMVKGSGEDPVEDLAGDQGLDAERYDDRPRPGDRERDDRPRPGERDRDVSADERADHVRADVRDSGHLRLEVQPADASIYVDGQFRGTARQVSELELPPGRHRLEIVRPGFRTDDRDVDVEAGRTRDLRVELQRP
jgi:hypothetical protein